MNCLSCVQGFFIYPFTFGVLGCGEQVVGKGVLFLQGTQGSLMGKRDGQEQGDMDAYGAQAWAQAL